MQKKAKNVQKVVKKIPLHQKIARGGKAKK